MDHKNQLGSCEKPIILITSNKENLREPPFAVVVVQFYLGFSEDAAPAASRALSRCYCSQTS